MTEELLPGMSGLLDELIFTTSRSSGPGGQNVNKVNSRVTVNWDIANSTKLNEGQKALIFEKLSAKMTKDGVLILTAQDSRSQAQNKESVVGRLKLLLEKAFKKRKSRKATKPGKAAKKRRLQNKKQHSEKKQLRKKL